MTIRSLGLSLAGVVLLVVVSSVAATTDQQINSYLNNDILDGILGRSTFNSQINHYPASVNSIVSASEAVDVATTLNNRVQTYLLALGQLVKVCFLLLLRIFGDSLLYSICEL
jgi:hypothetical protein